MSKHTHQCMRIFGFDDLFKALQLIFKACNRTQNRLFIGKKNVVPHLRITGCDARKISKATRRITKNI